MSKALSLLLLLAVAYAVSIRAEDKNGGGSAATQSAETAAQTGSANDESELTMAGSDSLLAQDHSSATAPTPAGKPSRCCQFGMVQLKDSNVFQHDKDCIQLAETAPEQTCHMCWFAKGKKSCKDTLDKDHKGQCCQTIFMSDSEGTRGIANPACKASAANGEPSCWKCDLNPTGINKCSIEQNGKLVVAKVSRKLQKSVYQDAAVKECCLQAPPAPAPKR